MMLIHSLNNAITQIKSILSLYIEWIFLYLTDNNEKCFEKTLKVKLKNVHV